MNHLHEERRRQVALVNPTPAEGQVTEVHGPSIIAELSGAAIGDLVQIELSRALKTSHLQAQVIGFKESSAIITPFGSTAGITPGARVIVETTPPILHLGPELLGSVIDARGERLRSTFFAQAGPAVHCLPQTVQVNGTPPPPLSRQAIDSVFKTGVRAIDGLLTLGKGQRLGVFAEPGVGKSTLMASIARSSEAEVNVIGLIGERGREIREFIEDTLDEETRARSVVVVSTSDEAANRTIFAALTATRVAEYFRDQGLHVLLQIDSLTRLVRAYREVGLAAGEIPVRRGYPPSVFAELPRLIERTGTADKGSITALYTVLLSSDLDEDPMVEEIKGLTDGHLMLSKALAEKAQYPAVDVLQSVSRLAGRVASEDATRAASIVRRAIALLERDRELLSFAHSVPPELQHIATLETEIISFLSQARGEFSPLDETYSRLSKLADKLTIEE